MTFSGLAYLVWVLVAGISRDTVQDLIRTIAPKLDVPTSTRVVKIVFVDIGIAIDLVGLAWLALSLLLVGLSSRQRLGISWAWMSAIMQSCVAAVGAVLVGWAVQQPYFQIMPQPDTPRTALETVSTISLPVVVVLAVVVWIAFLVWLLIERARLARGGPTLRDGLRSNVYR